MEAKTWHLFKPVCIVEFDLSYALHCILDPMMDVCMCTTEKVIDEHFRYVEFWRNLLPTDVYVHVCKIYIRESTSYGSSQTSCGVNDLHVLIYEGKCLC